MSSVYEESLALHKLHKGKLEIHSKVAVERMEDLALAYSPGVAQPCREIVDDEENAYVYTNKGNTIAIVTDGSAVLGLGDIGAKAALPVMEGKAVLFKRFADIDAIPLCIDVHDAEGIITLVKALEPTFAGILMEDISAPKCVAIERTLKAEMNIPVFHDDQHGTAIITIAAIANMLRLTGKKKEDLRVVTCGVGAAGSSIIKMMHDFGIRHIEAFSSKGQMHQEKKAQYDFLKQELLQYVDQDGLRFDTMADAMVGADVFIGVSAPGLVNKDMVASMNEKSCVLAMANPTPEIMPEDALAAGAYIVGTGRSDYPNQVNNVLAFPGLFRGVLDVKATKITEGMKMAAAMALADLISDEELDPEHIIPTVFDPRVAPAVAKAVAACAKKEGNVR
ncbi:NAD-dependent malic enzyme [Clostridiaceae bacterium DONG20-135]|uniref:NAD-dependent malic enzyme n=1 Tax=Copranaerobaculum intestinale TaxID=2692629 RepID=A0A6N8U9M6_9FIRM|nr:NADP-dependent malic enzyme [Copranaerobaculum intestinale]MXQ72537.1 NAD-dependent malic enzyme [Copranaerobaculum intestinale]